MHIKGERRCIVCRQTKLQNQMLRIAKINDKFVIDKSNKLGGRGAYICNSPECLKQAIKKRLLNRAFKTNIDNSVYEMLGEYEQNN